MNLEIIKTKYPKAYTKFVEWCKTQITSTLGVSKEMLENFTEETLKVMLPAVIMSRAPYDFFDYYQIHMFPMGSATWVFKIVDPQTNHNNSENTTEYNTRREAEDAGFIVCFSILEEKLS